MRRIILLFVMFTLLLGGCKTTEITKENRKALDYTVVSRSEIPPELLAVIDERRMEEFSMSYSLDGYLYIAVGYGMKNTGGYSVRVDEVYETESNVGIHTTLIGPAAGEAVNKMATYPCIVVKLEYIDKKIIFE